MLVARDAIDQLRQSGPHNEMHPGWSIKTANKAVLGWINNSIQCLKPSLVHRGQDTKP